MEIESPKLPPLSHPREISSANTSVKSEADLKENKNCGPFLYIHYPLPVSE